MKFKIELDKFGFFHSFVIFLSITVTVSAWFVSKESIEEKIQNQFDREASQVVDLVKERMQKYEDALWAGVSTIMVSGGDISLEKWKVFSKSLHVEQKYPGINGIGVIYNIQKDNLQKFLELQRKSRPNFSVFPAHGENEYWPITYIEPVEVNMKAVGLDIAHETNRYQGALKARDTKSAQITGPIILVQDKEKTPGFLFYAPFYNNQIDINKLNFSELKKEIKGLVYAPFIMKKLMEGTLSKDKRHVGIKISDDNVTLYDELHNEENNFDPNSRFKKKVTLFIYGRNWNFDIWASKSFINTTNSAQPKLILFGGVFIDLLVIFLFIYLHKNNKRIRMLANELSEESIKKSEDLLLMNTLLKNEVEERKNAELEAREATVIKSTFLANMSHEIRTPMNGVISCTNILLDRCQDNESHQYLNLIKSSGDTLLRLINDILDFSKMEAGKVDLEIETFNIKECINNVASLFVTTAGESNINIICDIDCGIEIVNGDESRLKQILNNFLSNAVKFARSKVVFKVNSSKINDQKIIFNFEITDDGIGISGEEQEKLFKSFSQVDGSTTRKYGGTGLGLFISKGLIEMMNGKVSVKSAPSIGSTFEFSVCMEIVNELMAKNFKDNNTITEEIVYDFSGLKVLVAEDNKVNQIVISKFLNKLGVECEIVENGQEVLNYLIDHQVDIIFMDKHMPEMDGLQATHEIIKRYINKKPYIVALTASALIEDKIECLQAGMDEFLTKPLKLEEIKHVLKKVKNMKS